MKTVELFAGAGGLAPGLHEAGFRPPAVVERDEDSGRTLHENWRQTMGVEFKIRSDSGTYS